MRCRLLMAGLAVLSTACSILGAEGAPPPGAEQSPLLFTSFRGNGEDGLHLAWSKDGYTWTPLKDDKPLLRPEVGGEPDARSADPPGAGRHLPHGLDDGLEQARHRLRQLEGPDPLVEAEAAGRDAERAAGPQRLGAGTLLRLGRQAIHDLLGLDDPRPFSRDGQDGRQTATTTACTSPSRADFERLAPAKLFYDPGFNVIDATIVQDGKRFVMFLKDETRASAGQEPAAWPRPRRRPAPTARRPADHGQVLGRRSDCDQAGRDVVRVLRPLSTERRYGLVTSKDLVHWDEESDKVRFPGRPSPRQRAARRH